MPERGRARAWRHGGAILFFGLGVVAMWLGSSVDQPLSGRSPPTGVQESVGVVAPAGGFGRAHPPGVPAIGAMNRSKGDPRGGHAAGKPERGRARAWRHGGAILFFGLGVVANWPGSSVGIHCFPADRPLRVLKTAYGGGSNWRKNCT